MIFLAALLFALLFFVLPGEWLLVLGLRAVAPDGAWGLGAFGLLGAANALAFALVYGVVRLLGAYTKWFQADRSATFMGIAPWLQVQGCGGLNTVALLLIAAGTAVQWITQEMPGPFLFLMLAALLGFWDLSGRKRDLWEDWVLDPLPAPEPEPTAPHVVLRATGRTCPVPNAEVSVRLHPARVEQAGADQEGRDAARASSNGLRKFVLEGITSEIQDLAAQVRELSIAHGLTPVQEIYLAVSFVRGIPYAIDPETSGVEDYWNRPVETLARAAIGSDCEDHAILAAALLHQLGHDAALFHLTLPDSAHLAVGIHLSWLDQSAFGLSVQDRYYAYLETVPGDGELGQLTDEFLNNLQSSTVTPLRA